MLDWSPLGQSIDRAGPWLAPWLGPSNPNMVCGPLSRSTLSKRWGAGGRRHEVHRCPLDSTDNPSSTDWWWCWSGGKHTAPPLSSMPGATATSPPPSLLQQCRHRQCLLNSPPAPWTPLPPSPPSPKVSLSPSYSVCLSLSHSLLSDAKPSLFIQVNAYTRLDLLLGDPNRTNTLRPLVSSDESLPLVFIKRISIWVGCPCVAQSPIS